MQLKSIYIYLYKYITWNIKGTVPPNNIYKCYGRFHIVYNYSINSFNIFNKTIKNKTISYAQSKYSRHI